MKRYDEARILILRAAEVNNQDLPNHLVVVPEESIESRQVGAKSIVQRLEITVTGLICTVRGWQRFQNERS